MSSKKGRKITWGDKISKALTGRVGERGGWKHSVDTKLKIGLGNKGKLAGDKHPRWVPLEIRKCIVCTASFQVKQNSKKQICSRRCSGSSTRNNFYGRHHTDKTKTILRSKDKSYTKTDAFKLKVSIGTKKGIKNSSASSNPFHAWVRKYGYDKALIMRQDLNNKLSVCFSGKNNPMYGKPAPKGAGRGWSGYLDNIFFRSIHELSFLHKLIKQKIPFENAEKAIHKIAYIDSLGHERTYVADYIVGKTMIEIKPEKMKTFREVKLKQIYAEKWCKENDMIYEIITPVLLSHESIIKLVNEGRISWVGKSNEKYKKLCAQN